MCVSTMQTVYHVDIFCQQVNSRDQINQLQFENNMDQINCYQNVGTKLIVTPKCRDQNRVFAFIVSTIKEYMTRIQQATCSKKQKKIQQATKTPPANTIYIIGEWNVFIHTSQKHENQRPTEQTRDKQSQIKNNAVQRWAFIFTCYLLDTLIGVFAFT